MSLQLAPQLIADFAIGFIASALVPWVALRILAWLVIPFGVSYYAFGPENFSSTAVEGSGLFYMIFSYFVFLGLFASGFGTFLGYILRLVIKINVKVKSIAQPPNN
jgi:hypothetical protein